MHQLLLCKEAYFTPGIYADGYTPGIYADGYIIFIFPLVRSYVCSFFRHVSGICVKVSQVVHISASTYQKAFIFEPWMDGIHSMNPDPRVHAQGWG